MKTRPFFLATALGFLCVGVRAQETDPAPSASPPSPPPAEQPDKPAAPVVPDSPLIQKLRAAAANVSAPLKEIVKLSESGADASVIQAFVENSPVAYNPKAEEIIYLHDHGISNPIITAMIQHGAKVREQQAATQATLAASQPMPPPPIPGDAMAPQGEAPYEVTPPSDTYPVYPADPGYAYPYPNYYYPAYPTFGVYVAPPFYYGRPYYRGGYRSYGHGGFGGSGHGTGGGGVRPPTGGTHSSLPPGGTARAPTSTPHSPPSITGGHH